uniref:Unknown protein 3 (Fragments) n=1 Tax=Lonomia obliqua TaxID=304329 RepID=UP03_LONON|nr:RecName: Full=Unknown protein 3 [Lonomia obliqua]
YEYSVYREIIGSGHIIAR